MKKNLLVVAVVSAGLGFTLISQAGEPKREAVSLKSLPSSVQKTITQKAAGGEILKIEREEDRNGRWNYETTVKSNGKEWGFEVDKDGKYLGHKHDEAKEQKKHEH